MNPNEEANAADVTRLFKKLYIQTYASIEERLRRDYFVTVILKSGESRVRRDSGFARSEPESAK